jgi:putative SOS response-associated peptidase YedK
MCGRFVQSVPVKSVAEFFRAIAPDGTPFLPPRYNVAPTQQVLLIRPGPHGDERVLVSMRWGLIPSWAEDPAIGNRLINARSETAAEKPSFRMALKCRRCLVPVNGFYEWRKEGASKTPYYIKRADGKPFAFAGLWDQWVAPDGEVIESFTILTADANELMKPLHHRMPVILKPEEYDRWLDPKLQDVTAVQPFLRPYPDNDLMAYPVSKVVNNPRNETPACIEPISADGR